MNGRHFVKMLWDRRARGDAVLEMAVIVPLLALLLSAAVAMGPYVHITFAVRQAAYDCAVAAAQSLDQAQGYSQGTVAARLSFDAYGLASDLAQIDLSGAWERGGMVGCTVTYDIPVENFPLKLVVPLPESYSYTCYLPLQVWHSEWR